MKKFTKLMLTLALLVIGVDGVKAAETLVYSLDYSTMADKDGAPFWAPEVLPTGASVKIQDGLLVIENSSDEGENHALQLQIGTGISSIEGRDYKVKITYKTTTATSEGHYPSVALGNWDYRQTDWSVPLSVSDEFQTVTVELKNYAISASNLFVLWQSRSVVGTISIKKVEVYQIGPDAPTKTIRHYLRLSDSNLITDFWQPHTVNPADGTVLNESQNNNSAIAWYFNPEFDASDYTSLVVKLKSGAPADLKIRLYDSGGFWTGDNVRTSTTIAAGGTSAIIDLASIKKGDDTNLILNSIKYVDILNTSFTTTTYTIDEIYFEKEVDVDYVDLLELKTEDYNYGTLRATNGYVTTSWGNDQFGWQFDDGVDWSAFKYLVIVPKKQYSNDGVGTNKPVTTNIYNKTTEGFGEKIQLGWIGDWNPRRTRVFDLSSVEGLTRDNVGRLTLITEFGVLGEWGLSAAYLTNTQPIFCNANNETEATTKADHYRAATVEGAWGTVCLPYKAAVCGADIYEVVGVDSKDYPSKLYLEQVDGIMSAGKAYLYKSNTDQLHRYQAATYYTAEDEDVINGTKNVGDLKTAEVNQYIETGNVTFYRAGAEEVASPGTGYLHGTFVGATVPNDGYSYILKNGVWKKSTSGITNTVAANRAYLTITDNLVVPVSAAKEKGWLTWNMENGDITTGINNISDNTDKEVQTGIYDIQGRRMDNSTKLHRGLYIINGKKVFVK